MVPVQYGGAAATRPRSHQLNKQLAAGKRTPYMFLNKAAEHVVRGISTCALSSPELTATLPPHALFDYLRT